MASRQTITGTVTAAYDDAFVINGSTKFKYGNYYTGPKAEMGQKVRASGDPSKDGDMFWLKDLAFDSGHLQDVSARNLAQRLAEPVAQGGAYVAPAREAPVNTSQADRERDIRWMACLKDACLVYATTGAEASVIVSYATTLFHQPAPAELPVGDA